MSMTDIFRSLGMTDALTLRAEAHLLTGTEIIAREHAVPAFDADRDYTDCPVGTPVSDGGQVWLLLQPYNAAHYEGRPADLRALWGLAHTTDPARAKEWVDPYGTSGLYMAGECYRANDEIVYRALIDNVAHSADTNSSAWEIVKNKKRME